MHTVPGIAFAVVALVGVEVALRVRLRHRNGLDRGRGALRVQRQLSLGMHDLPRTQVVDGRASPEKHLSLLRMACFATVGEPTVPAEDSPDGLCSP